MTGTELADEPADPGADQPFAHIGARQHCCNDQLRRPDGFNILQRMDRCINPALCQPEIQLLGPQRLPAQLCQRSVLDLIPAGENGNDSNGSASIESR